MALKNKVDKLTIQGFQSIRELKDFELYDLNILIGPNGAGKSNFINYFRMLSELVEKRLQVWVKKRGGADRLLTFGVKETDVLSSRLEFGLNTYEFSLEPTNDGGFVFIDETVSFKSAYKKDNWRSLGSGHAESQLKDSIKQQLIASDTYDSITHWKLYHFHDTSDTAGVNRLGNLIDAEYLRSDAENLAAYLYNLRENYFNVYAQIRKTVQLAIPLFDDFVLNPQTLSNGEEQIRLIWRQKNSDYPLWPTQLSDGSIRFICLATALLQPNPPSTIIIDEPELGLHPYALTLLGSLIRSASTRMQIIISTQSVPLLNEFEIKDLIVVEREDDVSVFKRLDEADFEEWLQEYSVGELWEKNLFGGRP